MIYSISNSSGGWFLLCLWGSSKISSLLERMRKLFLMIPRGKGYIYHNPNLREHQLLITSIFPPPLQIEISAHYKPHKAPGFKMIVSLWLIHTVVNTAFQLCVFCVVWFFTSDDDDRKIFLHVAIFSKYHCPISCNILSKWQHVLKFLPVAQSKTVAGVESVLEVFKLYTDGF